MTIAMMIDSVSIARNTCLCQAKTRKDITNKAFFTVCTILLS